MSNLLFYKMLLLVSIEQVLEQVAWSRPSNLVVVVQRGTYMLLQNIILQGGSWSESLHT